MHSILQVFLFSLINDLDNVLILLTVLRKYMYNRVLVFLAAIFLITVSRSSLIFLLQPLIMLPGLRLFSGLVVIWLALRLVKINMRTSATVTTPFYRLLLILLFTDLAICIDSVLVIAQLSVQLAPIVIGLLCSFTLLFLVVFCFYHAIFSLSWVPIVAGGLMTQIAVSSIAQDSFVYAWLSKWISAEFFSYGVTIFSIALAIQVMLVGFLHAKKA